MIRGALVGHVRLDSDFAAFQLCDVIVGHVVLFSDVLPIIVQNFAVRLFVITRNVRIPLSHGCDNALIIYVFNSRLELSACHVIVKGRRAALCENAVEIVDYRLKLDFLRFGDFNARKQRFDCNAAVFYDGICNRKVIHLFKIRLVHKARAVIEIDALIGKPFFRINVRFCKRGVFVVVFFDAVVRQCKLVGF